MVFQRRSRRVVLTKSQFIVSGVASARLSELLSFVRNRWSFPIGYILLVAVRSIIVQDVIGTETWMARLTMHPAMQYTLLLWVALAIHGNVIVINRDTNRVMANNNSKSQRVNDESTGRERNIYIYIYPTLFQNYKYH